jgi:hypothetical protein
VPITAVPLSDDNVADDVKTDSDIVNLFMRNQTIPHKIKLYDCIGSDITTTAAVAVKLAVATGATGISDGALILIDSALDFDGVGSADGSMEMNDAHYQFNLKTRTEKYAKNQQFQSLARVVYKVAPTILAGQGQDGEGEDALLESR